MGIITAIIVLGVLVFVHELGHFLVAKYFGVGVLEFSLGFGTPLYQWQGGATTYSIRAVPLGGFVRMAGDDPLLVFGEERGDGRKEAGGASPIEGTQEDLTPEQQALIKDERCWFLKKSYLPKCLIVLAGPFANFLFAWVLAFGVCWSKGVPELVAGPVTVGSVQRGLPAEAAGLKAGDKILSVNGQSLSTFTALLEMVQSSKGKPLELDVERPQVGERGQVVEGGSIERLRITVSPAVGAHELDVLEGRPVNETLRIGISPSIENMRYRRLDLIAAVDAASHQVWTLTQQTLRILKGLVTGLLSPTKTLGGPIEIIRQTAASADAGWLAVIGWMIFLNVTLGVMNLLPIPVLDGGHLTFFTIERLQGRPLSMKIQIAATNVGLLIILSLMTFALGNDLYRYFTLSQ